MHVSLAEVHMRTAIVWTATVAILFGMVSLAEARSKEQYRGRYQLRLDEARGLLGKRTVDPASHPKNVSGPGKWTTGSKK
jgi:hypothetical protein